MLLLCLVVAAGCGTEDDGSDRGSTAPAEQPIDPQPAADAAEWLTGELTAGVVHNEQYDLDDVGLSLDVGLAVDAAGTPGADLVVEEIAAATLDAPAVLTPYVGTPSDGQYAGALAKAVVFAGVAGRDPADLVTSLEGLVATDDRLAGRVADSGAQDYATVVSQAYTVWALGEIGSPGADAATDYLLTQQCADGWFRATLPKPDAPDQACDADPASAPDVDTTALAVLALTAGADDDAEAAAAVDLAVRWLVDTQADDGSFVGEDVVNANSTGLAGWALGDYGETEAAAAAAAWLVGVQVPPDAAGPLAADAGAVPYDAAALAAGEKDGIGPKTSDQWRRATAQALPGLAYAAPS